MLKHFICDATSQPVHFQDCYNCAKSERAVKTFGCLHSSDVIKGLVHNTNRNLEGFSVTELLDCPRAIYLKRRHDYGIKPSKLYWAFRGVIAHKMMEVLQDEGDISEKRFFAKLGGMPISGQPDLIRGDVIYDFKTTARIPVTPHTHHIQQLSYYRVLLGLQDPPIQVTRGKIVYIDMMKHSCLETALLPFNETKEEMRKALELLHSQVEPTFEDNFDINDWKCGSSEDKTYCEVRGICTKDRSLGVATPKVRRRTVAG